jgi:hypothetical protein
MPDMTAEDKDYLSKLLSDSHAATQSTIEGTDPEWQVYEDSGWRIRDVISHIAEWDRQVTKSLRAYQAGTEYAISNLDEDDFNEVAVMEQRALSTEQVYEEWEAARQDFIEAVQEIPDDSFPGDLLYPWGDERGGIAQLVQYMVDHDAEHQEEIVKAIRTSNDV